MLSKSSSPLGKWIAANMPELDAELGPMALDDVRIRLNQITGLSIGPANSISGTMPLYLDRLKEIAAK